MSELSCPVHSREPFSCVLPAVCTCGAGEPPLYVGHHTTELDSADNPRIDALKQEVAKLREELDRLTRPQSRVNYQKQIDGLRYTVAELYELVSSCGRCEQELPYLPDLSEFNR